MVTKLLLGRAQALCSSHAFNLRLLSGPLVAFANRCFVKGSRFYSVATPGDLRKTPLYDFHVAHGAKMVPFAGHHMPVLYSSLGLAESHHFTRSCASLFDVSHMVQHRFEGPGAARFLETACPSGIAALPHLRGGLTTFLWPETGGIVDDAIVTRLDDNTFYVVTNGACRDKDLVFFDEQLARFRLSYNEPGDAVERTSYQAGLLALQGPLSAAILGQVLADGPTTRLPGLLFGNSMWARFRLIDGTTTGPLLVSRGGYTGEDGFEIAAAPSVTLTSEMTRLAETLLTVAGPDKLQLAGLGARDSLRLEAGMCLYGHDLDDTTTPVEAGLAWVIPPERRTADGAGSSGVPFNGSDVVLSQLVSRSKGGRGVDRRRVGLLLEEGAGPAARGGAEIRAAGEDKDAEEVVGIVTSGMPSPTLGRNIAMGYLRDGLHKAGTEVDVITPTAPDSTTDAPETTPAASTQVITTVTPDGSTSTFYTTIVTSNSPSGSASPTTVAGSSDTGAVDSSGSSSSSPGSSGGLEGGSRIAITVVVPVAAVALIVLAFLFWWRRRKQWLANEEQRKQELDDYSYTPHADPTIPAITGQYVPKEDRSGYRGWGTTVAGSATLSNGFSDGTAPKDVQHMAMALDAEMMGAAGAVAAGAGTVAHHNKIKNTGIVHRGLSNASSQYSTASHSDVSDGIGVAYSNPNAPTPPYYEPYHVSLLYNTSAAGPLPAGPQQQQTMPVIRDNPARKNLRIENLALYHPRQTGIS